LTSSGATRAAIDTAGRYCTDHQCPENNALIKQHILCYGDSMSWGIIPGTRNRHAFEKRWPGILQGLLGPDTRVVEECLNGRTTAWNDPFRPSRRGQDLLLPLLQSHSPLDLVVVFLGTNDLQAMYGVGAHESAQGAATIVDAIQASRAEPMDRAPAVLLVSPPRIVRPSGPMEQKFRGAEEKSQGFSTWYAQVAAAKQCGFFDAADVIRPSTTDGVHLDEAQHREFAEAILPLVRSLLADPGPP
jgi:lysophospholipase L1-like esterase